MFRHLISSPKFLRIGFFISLAILLFISTLSIWDTDHLITDADRVVHTQQVLASIRTLQIAVNAVEGVAQVPAIDQSHLLPLVQSRAQAVTSQIQHLRDLTADNINQQNRLDTLDPLVQQELTLIQSIVKAGGSPAASQSQLDQSSALENLHNSIGQALLDMRGEEITLLEQRSTVSLSAAQLTANLSRLGLVVSGVVMLIIIVLVGRAETTRRQATEALVQSELQARIQYKSIPMPTYTWKKRGDDLILIDCNDAAAAATQGHVADLMGVTAKKRLAHEPVIADIMQQCLNDHQTHTLEMPYLYPLTEVPRYLTIICVFAEPDLVLAYTLDTTERKNAEKALAQERNLMRVMIDQLPDYIFVKDREHRYLLSNLSHALAAGVERPEDLIGKKGADFFPTDVVGQHDADDSATLEQGLVMLNSERETVDAQRNQRWVLTTKIPLRDSQGNIIGLVGISHDITEQKKAQIALRDSELRLRRITDNMLDVILQINNDHIIEYASPSSWSILGYEPSELVAYNVDEDVHPDDLLVMQASIAADGKAEYRFRHADGHYVWLETISAFLFDESGKGIGMVFTSRDVTERRAILESLRAAKIQAESASASKSLFLANMSHELRTPLNAILGFTQLLQQGSTLADEQRRYIDIISQSGEHLLGMINEVLEIAKIEAGRAVLNDEDFDLFRLLDGLDEMLGLRARTNKLQLLFERSPKLPQYVRGDQRKLRQVLINLVNNAIKFTHDGGVTVRIQLRDGPPISQMDTQLERSQKVSLAFEVEDSGEGMSQEEIGTLFTSYAQTKSGLNALEGTGLGLTISREYVRLMGGELVVASEEDKGTLIKFSIDVSVIGALLLPSTPDKRRVAMIADGQPTYRILIVEDRLENRLLLTQLMKGVGFDTREAVNGREAIEIWEQWQPHFIWMDMQMPVMDGYEATKYIRTHNQSEAPIIIALTASAFEHEHGTVLDTGCNDIVSKPFQASRLFEKMTEYLGVQFVYEEGAHSAAKASSQRNMIAAAAKMKNVPLTTRNQLRQAAVKLDSDAVLAIVEQFRSQDPLLADDLDEYVRTFQFNGILELIDSAEA